MNPAVKQILYILLYGASLGLSVHAAPNADNFRHLLQTADCSFLEADHAIDIRVFDMKFPLASGFFFAGHEVEGVTFRKHSELSPLEYMEQYPDVSLEEAVANLSAQQASVIYFNAEQEGKLSNPDLSEFEPLEWDGLSLLYRLSVGGR